MRGIPVAAFKRELEQERHQLMMTDDEREISTRLLEIEARLKTAGVDVSNEIRNSLEKELVAILNLRKGREEANEAQKKADADLEKRQQGADEDMKRRAEAVEDVFSDIRDAAKDSIKDVIKGTESIGDAFQKLADRITDILLDLALEELLGGGTGFSDVFGAIFGGIGSLLGGGGAATSAASLSRATAAGAFTTFRPTGGAFGFHEGGVVGLDGRPFRYHNGGISGLRPDEVPAVLQRGEEVLTANDPRHRDNGGASSGVVVHNHFPNARNTEEARQAGSEIAAKTAAAAQRGMMRKGFG